MSKHSSPHDWLNLVQLSGLLVSEPVLATAFPDGPERVPSHVYRRFGREWERVSVRPARSAYAGVNSSQSNKTSQIYNDQSRWIDFVLEDLLELRRESWRKSNDLPEDVSVSLMEYSQTLRPSRVLMSADDKPALLVSIVPPTQNLDKAETQTGRWKASPFTKLDRLLRETGVPLGLLTNGVEWRLVYAEKSLTTASITWTANEWSSEKTKLDAFYTLINAKRFWTQTLALPARASVNADDADVKHKSAQISVNQRPISLLELIKQSQARQIDVADQLGEQVRAAVEVFVRALDEADRSAGGAILAGLALDRVYEMALSLMMRLVFVLYAEENGLLPHGEVLYDRAYGLTHLVYRLEQDRQSDGERLAQTYDAWPQLLATFRLIHAGCPHPDLILLAYGGELFDPARYLNAAGDAAASTPVLEHPQLRIDNAAIYAILRKLTFARARLGRETLQQRVSYRTLDIEQIGYVYEGLLDHKLARAGDEVRVKLAGRAEAIVPLSELTAVAQDGILRYLAEKTDRKPETIGRLLAAIDDDDVIELRDQYGSDMADRIAPFAGVMATDGVIWPNRLYVTAGESRRATGAHYTPQTLTEPIVRATLEPLLYRGAGPKPAQVTFGTGSLIGPREILNLKVCDMAMGSASFHVQADRYLAERLVEAWDLIEHERPGLQITPFGEASRAGSDEQLLPPDRDERRLLARRLVAERCLYGVDKNPLAVEIAKLSMWLVTMAKDRPFTFLDHAFKCGDSLVGADEDMFERWSHTDTSSTLPLFAGELRAQLAEALQARQKLQSFVVRDVRDAEEKARLLHAADAALQRIKLGCDLIIGLRLLDAKPAEQNAHLLDLLDEYAAKPTPDSALARKALAAARHVHAFHWPFEFPEVFLHDESSAARSGFDAFVGNPPFLGGKRIPATIGEPYAAALSNLFASWNGNADLSAFFFVRAFHMLCQAGCLGLIATNTISQGDTRDMGLGSIEMEKGQIYAATSSMLWPGEAAVYVSVVHIIKAVMPSRRILNEVDVSQISVFLDTSASASEPKRLRQNTSKSFQGSIPLGTGFILDPSEAQRLLESNLANEDVLFQYLTGADLNSQPDQSPTRWIINFGERDESQAQKYPECFALVRDKIYPERIQKDRAKYPRMVDEWWKFWNPRFELYDTISNLQRTLVRARISDTHAVTFVPTDWVFADTIVVLAYDDYYSFSILQSSIHEEWARKYGSTLKSDLRYSPTDCVETFAFPQRPAELHHTALARLGQEYYEHRLYLMRNHNEGLTRIYNRFHDPTSTDTDIEKLRRVHAEIDKAVVVAYGWSDIELEHEFRLAGRPISEVPGELTKKEIKRVRYSFTETATEEILRRLLDLNLKIATSEEIPAGQPRRKSTIKRTKHKQKTSGESKQMGLL